MAGSDQLDQHWSSWSLMQTRCTSDANQMQDLIACVAAQEVWLHRSRILDGSYLIARRICIWLRRHCIWLRRGHTWLHRGRVRLHGFRILLHKGCIRQHWGHIWLHGGGILLRCTHRSYLYAQGTYLTAQGSHLDCCEVDAARSVARDQFGLICFTPST